MRARLRLFLCMLLGVAVLAPLAGSATAGAAPGTSIGGVAFGFLPAGLGQASDFTYEYEDVTFVARVWESQIPDGWRVDADVEVLSGPRLSSGTALHDWFIAYQDRPPAQARYVPVRVHGRPGWLARDELFWLVRPGLAVSVQLDGARWSTGEVVRTAWSAELISPSGS